MKTDQLITLLAADVAPVPRHAATRRVLLAWAAGSLLALAWLLAEYGLRADLRVALQGGAFWAKLAFPASLAVAGALLLQRLGRPGVAPGAAAWALLMPVALVWIVAGVQLLLAPQGERLPLVMGTTWRSCAWNIAILSLPVFGAALLALRSLAPTRPRLAGAAAGVLAGGAGASVYAFHCPEMQAPFLAIWYLAGMALPVALGALVGPKLLRW